MSGSKILASAHYVPSDIVTNDDLAKIMDTNDKVATIAELFSQLATS